MLNARVLSLDYRRAPEHPFPLPLHDSIAAYLYLIQVEKYDPSQIFIMGDSAGGGLASAIMTWLKNRPQFRYERIFSNFKSKLLIETHLFASMPAGLVLISPFLDLTLRQPSFILNRPFDFLTGLVGDEKTVRDPKWLHSSINNNNNNNTDTSRPNRTHYYCQDDTILMHPLVSPIYATNLSTPYIPDSANQQSSSTNQQKQQQLPSILIQAGHSELFRDECIHYFSKTLPASSDVRLELYDGMVHVFHIFTLFEPMAVLAFDRIIEFVLEKMRRRSELEAASTMQQQVQENVCLHIKKTSISANNFEINSISHPYAEFVEPGIKVLDKMKLEHGIGFEDLLPKVDDFKLAAVESPTDSAYDCSDLI